MLRGAVDTHIHRSMAACMNALGARVSVVATLLCLQRPSFSKTVDSFTGSFLAQQSGMKHFFSVHTLKACDHALNV